MSDHISKEEIRRFSEQALTPERLLALDDHLAVCQDCRDRLSRSKQTEMSAFSIGADHLTYEQLEQYVDDRLPAAERELIESHIETCASCLAEANDLGEFISTFEAPRRSAPVVEPPRLWERLFAFWRAPAYSRALLAAGTVAAIAAVVTIAALFAMLPLQRRVAQLEQQVSDLREENDALQEDRAAVAEMQSELERLRQESQALQPAQAGDDPSSPRLALKDGGGLIAVNSDGGITGLDGLSPSESRMVRTALESGQVETPSAVSELIGRTGALMGSAGQGAAFALISPTGTAVESDRPSFRWSALPGATGYRVGIYDSNLNEAASSQVISATEWRPPRGLARGAVYSWQVTAIKEGEEIVSPVPPAPEAKFRIIDRAALSRLNRVRERHPGSRLMKGLAYAGAGLLDEAEREFAALLAANPDSSAAKRLLRSVRSLRRGR